MKERSQCARYSHCRTCRTARSAMHFRSVWSNTVSGWCACVRAWCPSLGRRVASRSLPDVRSCLCTMHMRQRPWNATDTRSWPPAATVVLWHQFANCILTLRRNLLLPSSGYKSMLQRENWYGYWGDSTGTGYVSEKIATIGLNRSKPSGHYMYRTADTICTASLTFNNSTFCPHSVFMCSVWIWEQTAIIFLYSINWLVCITNGECLLRGTSGMSIIQGFPPLHSQTFHFPVSFLVPQPTFTRSNNNHRACEQRLSSLSSGRGFVRVGARWVEGA
jgi:hypothetical protein